MSNLDEILEDILKDYDADKVARHKILIHHYMDTIKDICYGYFNDFGYDDNYKTGYLDLYADINDCSDYTEFKKAIYQFGEETGTEINIVTNCYLNGSEVDTIEIFNDGIEWDSNITITIF